MFLWPNDDNDMAYISVGMWAIPAGILSGLLASDIRYGYSIANIIARELTAIVVIIVLSTATLLYVEYGLLRIPDYLLLFLFPFIAAIIAAIASEFIHNKSKTAPKTTC